MQKRDIRKGGMVVMVVVGRDKEREREGQNIRLLAFFDYAGNRVFWSL